MYEDSMDEGAPGPVIADDQTQPVQHEIVESSTQRGKMKLVDSSGYSIILSNGDTVKIMLFGGVLSEIKLLLVWRLSGSMV